MYDDIRESIGSLYLMKVAGEIDNIDFYEYADEMIKEAGFFGTLVGKLGSGAGKVMGGLRSGIGRMAGGARGIANKGVNVFDRGLQAVSDKVTAARKARASARRMANIKNIGRGVIEGAGNFARGTINAFRTGGQRLASGVKGLFSRFGNGSKAMAGAAPAVAGAAPAVAGAGVVQQAANPIWGAVKKYAPYAAASAAGVAGLNMLGNTVFRRPAPSYEHTPQPHVVYY